jgi:16S rRNA (guanine527-N7)-methyltransferase
MCGAPMPPRPDSGGVAGGNAGTLDAAAFQTATGVSRETVDRLERYAAALRKWQPAINLVGPKTLDDLWRRHMLDSAQLLAQLPAPPGASRGPLVDLGSGAGFPGLVLAICGVPDVHLIESDQRKAVFLAEVARLTDTPVTVHRRRIEDVPAFPAAVVTARALAPLSDLLGLAARFSAENTVGLFLKGRDWQRELILAQEAWMMRATPVPSTLDPDSVVLRVDNLRRKDSHGRP